MKLLTTAAVRRPLTLALALAAGAALLYATALPASAAASRRLANAEVEQATGLPVTRVNCGDNFFSGEVCNYVLDAGYADGRGMLAITRGTTRNAARDERNLQDAGFRYQAGGPGEWAYWTAQTFGGGRTMHTVVQIEGEVIDIQLSLRDGAFSDQQMLEASLTLAAMALSPGR